VFCLTRLVQVSADAASCCDGAPVVATACCLHLISLLPLVRVLHPQYTSDNSCIHQHVERQNPLPDESTKPVEEGPEKGSSKCNMDSRGSASNQLALVASSAVACDAPAAKRGK
jgi:hypothetical protein